MEGMVNKTKAVYSKNERILRLICFLGIIICEVIGILFFIIGNIVGGIIILLSCAVSSFLVSSFFIRRIKARFGSKEKKRAIYALFYAIAILICMVTTVIFCFNLSHSADELATISIEHVEQTIKNDSLSIEIIETDLFDSFEVNDSYYFALETHYKLTENDGAVSTHYPVTYIKINKYTKSITVIDFVQFERARTYTK